MRTRYAIACMEAFLEVAEMGNLRTKERGSVKGCGRVTCDPVWDWYTTDYSFPIPPESS